MESVESRTYKFPAGVISEEEREDERKLNRMLKRFQFNNDGSATYYSTPERINWLSQNGRDFLFEHGLKVVLVTMPEYYGDRAHMVMEPRPKVLQR